MKRCLVCCEAIMRANLPDRETGCIAHAVCHQLSAEYKSATERRMQNLSFEQVFERYISLYPRLNKLKLKINFFAFKLKVNYFK